MSPPFFSFISDGPKQAELILNLGPYIEAYENRLEDSALAYEKLREELSHAVEGGLVGDLLWIHMLDLAIVSLSESEKQVIKSSLACELLDNHAVELIKNLMDEAILGFYDNQRSPEVKLTMRIDTEHKPELIVITLLDSGRGFPHAFLENVNTPKSRNKYLQKQLSFFEHAFNSNSSLDNMASSSSNKNDRAELPALFGGRGRGLRCFISAVEGHNIKKVGTRRERYAAEGHAFLVLDNQLNDTGDVVEGAKITLTTSIALQENLKKQCVGKNSPLSVTTDFGEEIPFALPHKPSSCCSCFN